MAYAFDNMLEEAEYLKSLPYDTLVKILAKGEGGGLYRLFNVASVAVQQKDAREAFDAAQAKKQTGQQAGSVVEGMITGQQGSSSQGSFAQNRPMSPGVPNVPSEIAAQPVPQLPTVRAARGYNPPVKYPGASMGNTTTNRDVPRLTPEVVASLISARRKERDPRLYGEGRANYEKGAAPVVDPALGGILSQMARVEREGGAYGGLPARPYSMTAAHGGPVGNLPTVRAEDGRGFSALDVVQNRRNAEQAAYVDEMRSRQKAYEAKMEAGSPLQAYEERKRILEEISALSQAERNRVPASDDPNILYPNYTGTSGRDLHDKALTEAEMRRYGITPGPNAVSQLMQAQAREDEAQSKAIAGYNDAAGANDLAGARLAAEYAAGRRAELDHNEKWREHGDWQYPWMHPSHFPIEERLIDPVAGAALAAKYADDRAAVLNTDVAEITYSSDGTSPNFPLVPEAHEGGVERFGDLVTGLISAHPIVGTIDNVVNPDGIAGGHSARIDRAINAAHAGLSGDNVATTTESGVERFGDLVPALSASTTTAAVGGGDGDDVLAGGNVATTTDGGAKLVTTDNFVPTSGRVKLGSGDVDANGATAASVDQSAIINQALALTGDNTALSNIQGERTPAEITAASKELVANLQLPITELINASRDTIEGMEERSKASIAKIEGVMADVKKFSEGGRLPENLQSQYINELLITWGASLTTHPTLPAAVGAALNKSIEVKDKYREDYAKSLNTLLTNTTAMETMQLELANATDAARIALAKSAYEFNTGAVEAGRQFEKEAYAANAERVRLQTQRSAVEAQSLAALAQLHAAINGKPDADERLLKSLMDTKFKEMVGAANASGDHTELRKWFYPDKDGKYSPSQYRAEAWISNIINPMEEAKTSSLANDSYQRANRASYVAAKKEATKAWEKAKLGVPNAEGVASTFTQLFPNLSIHSDEGQAALRGIDQTTFERAFFINKYGARLRDDWARPFNEDYFVGGGAGGEWSARRGKEEER